MDLTIDNAPKQTPLVLPIDYAVLDDLRSQYGLSFYILDTERFRDSLDRLHGAFVERWPRTDLSYSYKTNYAPTFCRAVNAMGGYAEVVSRMEYDLALRNGVLPARIILNGPGKSYDTLLRAILNGSLVNIDGFEEATHVKRIAKEYPRQEVKIGLRCALALTDERESRFGFSHRNGDIFKVCEFLAEEPKCKVIGLHAHCSRDRSAAEFERRTQFLVDIAREVIPEAPRYLDIGGGFFGSVPKSMASNFSIKVPTYTDYADSVAKILKSSYKGEKHPTLVIEPGAAVASDAVLFVASVIEVKNRGDRCVAVTSGSYQNIRPNAKRIDLPIEIFAPDGKRRDCSAKPVDLSGYTCIESDYLGVGLKSEVRTGDFIAISNVGAYSIVFKPPFIREMPAVLEYNPLTRAFIVVKRGETLDDLLATWSFTSPSEGNFAPG
jgi:diaminopimelate decarboxylase